MNLEEIKRLRALQPKNWKWRKNYYLDKYMRNAIDKDTKHYALNNPSDKEHVVSWNLVSINNGNTGDKFGDVHTEFVEKSLEMIDFLLEEIDKLNNQKQK